jgi:Crinkler effector protein N-terminal domain
MAFIPQCTLSSIFKGAPSPGVLHILVQLPSSCEFFAILLCSTDHDSIGCRSAIHHYILVMVSLSPSASPVPQAMFCLNCLVLGNTHNCIFPVKISSARTVGVLRDAIKDKKQYACLTDQLDLFHTLPNDGKLEKNLEDLDFKQPFEPTSIRKNHFFHRCFKRHLYHYMEIYKN